MTQTEGYIRKDLPWCDAKNCGKAAVAKYTYPQAMSLNVNVCQEHDAQLQKHAMAKAAVKGAKP